MERGPGAQVLQVTQETNSPGISALSLLLSLMVIHSFYIQVRFFFLHLVSESTLLALAVTVALAMSSVTNPQLTSRVLEN